MQKIIKVPGLIKRGLSGEEKPLSNQIKLHSKMFL
jgi:hypothetical protein